MNKVSERLKNFNWYDFLLILLFILFFRQAIVYIWHTFTSREFYENGIGFILVSTIFIISVLKKEQLISPKNKTIPFISLTGVLILYIVNAVIFKLSIVPAILFFLGVYCLLGFYLERQFWKRSIYVFLILIFTLPLLERVQKFLGFPIRLATANIVRSILQITGIGNVSNSAVIVTENHATSIDLPCSGVKSIYTGGLFMLSTYFLQNVRLSVKLIAITVLFFISLLFFNTWRVFSLIYIYDVLDMKWAGDAIHLVLGILGFTASCISLWYLTNKYVPSLTSRKTLNEVKPTWLKGNVKLFSIIFFSFFLLLQVAFIKDTDIVNTYKQQTAYSITLNSIILSDLAFSRAEESYFVNSDVEFSKKFTGQTKDGIQFSLLVVSSKSARTHHDPEICLQGLGHTISNSEIFQINDFRVRKLSLDDNKATAIYWFVGKDKNLLDYSERVWEEVKNPKKSWVLIAIGFSEPIDVSRPDVKDLILQVNSSAKLLL